MIKHAEPRQSPETPARIEFRHTLRLPETSRARIHALAWLPSGRGIVSGASDGSLRSWDLGDRGEHIQLGKHDGAVHALAILPDGRLLASSADDGTVRVWDLRQRVERTVLQGHQGKVTGIALDPARRALVSCSSDCSMQIWDLETGSPRFTLNGHDSPVRCLAILPDGRLAISGAGDGCLKLWDLETYIERGTLRGPRSPVTAVVCSPTQRIVITGTEDRTLHVWDPRKGKVIRSLEGHLAPIYALAISSDGRFLASQSADGTIRVWDCSRWETVAHFPEYHQTSDPREASGCAGGLGFFGTEVMLASVADQGRVIHVWDVEPYIRPPAKARRPPSEQYVNAKVVLVGDSGVGKSGLAHVLAGEGFRATDSTHGRRIWTFDEQTVQDQQTGATEVRETLLWDLAGQPSYRLIHQLHLSEVAVALVVFDVRSETDPFAGVRHWDRALRQAARVQGESGIPLRKFLVAARCDRGGIPASDARLHRVLEEHGFDGFFQTSAKEGWGVAELSEAIRKIIPWEESPRVSSTELFKAIKAYILRVSRSGRTLATTSDLLKGFVRRVFRGEVDQGCPRKYSGLELLNGIGQFSESVPQENLHAAFETCIGRLEARGLIRRLSFGNLVLLQPEQLDGYASSLVQAAKEEPDGLGCIAEDAARAARFRIPSADRILDAEQERLLCNVMVEDLLRHEIGLREQTPDGPHLVFPSQFTRDWEEAPDPPGQAVVLTFDGPVLNVYATLAVRLSHSGVLEKSEMWRNAATYRLADGGKCGIYLREFTEGRGELTLFFDETVREAFRLQLEEYVLLHLRRRALPESIRRRRIHTCTTCGEPVPPRLALRRQQHGLDWVSCGFCQSRVALVDGASEPLRAAHGPVLARMDEHADKMRDREVTMASANGELQTRSFLAWVGATRATIALVFTDMVGSTAMTQRLGDLGMDRVRRAHFQQGARLIQLHKGYKVKTTGDGFLAAFRSTESALDFVLDFHADTGDPGVRICSAIHVGPVTVEEADVYGGTVNFTARMEGCAVPDEILLSERAKTDIEQAGRHAALRFTARPEQAIKGLEGQAVRLWSLRLSGHVSQVPLLLAGEPGR